jgi:hypothetical protein
MIARRVGVLLVVVGILLGVWSYYLVAVSKPVVQREAEVDASLQLLAEFHEEYLRRKGVHLGEYKAELAVFKQRHSGLTYLGHYAEKVEGR